MSGNISFCTARRLDLVKRIEHDILDRYEIIICLSLQHLENFLFRILHDLIYAVFSGITRGGDLLIYFNEPAQRSFFRHDLRIRFYIDRSRHSSDQLSRKFQAADFRRHILFPQPVLQSHKVDRAVLRVQLHHRFKQNSILFLVKILRRQDL